MYRRLLPLLLLFLLLSAPSPAWAENQAPPDQAPAYYPLFGRLNELFQGYQFDRRDRKDPFATRDPRGGQPPRTPHNLSELYAEVEKARDRRERPAFQQATERFRGEVRRLRRESALSLVEEAQVRRMLERIQAWENELYGDPLPEARRLVEGLAADLERSVQAPWEMAEICQRAEQAFAQLEENLVEGWVDQTERWEETRALLVEARNLRDRLQLRNTYPVTELKLQGITIMGERARVIINNGEYREGETFRFQGYEVLIEEVTPLKVAIRFDPEPDLADETRLTGEHWELRIER